MGPCSALCCSRPGLYAAAVREVRSLGPRPRLSQSAGASFVCVLVTIRLKRPLVNGMSLLAWPRPPITCDVSGVSRAPAADPVLAAVLRRLREDRGLTMEALAFKSGVSIGSLGRIERGRSSAAWSTVVLIADALGVSMAEIGAAVDAER